MLKKTRMAALLVVGMMAVFGQLALAQAELDITFTPESPSVNQQVCFVAEVVVGDPSWFILYEWDFDQDGVYDGTGRSICHIFTLAGSFVVTLRATDDRSGIHFEDTLVTVTNRSPVAAFTYSPAFPIAGSLVSFDASASSDPDGTIATYEWDFDQDGIYDATGVTTRYTFTLAGVRQVTLRVTDDGGLQDAVADTVPVQPVLPIACFVTSPELPSVYDNIQFSAVCSVDPDGGQIVQYSWVFGDGGTATGVNPIHQYANSGVYEVILTVIDDEQQVDTVVGTVVIDGPGAAFSYAPLFPTTQDSVQFFDQSSDTSEDIVSWSWDFADGAFSSDQNPLHTFAQSGTYRVMLTVTSAGGATASTIRTVTVLNSPPTAEYTFTPETPKVDQMVTFSAGGSGDPDGTVVMYEWDFDNDGITDATGLTVTHAFSIVGARPVGLRVTDNEGVTVSVTHVVPVQATPPIACFEFTPAEPNTGQAIAYDASCSADLDGTIILYEWDFDGDGLTDATGMSVTHAFPSVGVYPVTLMVTDNDGTVSADTQGIPVEVGGTSGDNQPPEAEFTFEPAEEPDVNLNEVVTFRSDGSSDPDGSIASYEWDFDRDGIYDATGATVAHIYNLGGAKIVTLRVTDNDGDVGFKTHVVSVEFIRPTAEFSYVPQQPRIGDVITFDGSASLDRDGTIEFYAWDFDNDGEADATGQTVNRVFNQGGNIPVTLVVTDDNGVTDAITRSITMAMNNPPIAQFTYTPEYPTTADTIVFSSSSVDAEGKIAIYLWDFGDGTTSSAQTPSHKYSVPKTYEVTLTVQDKDGAVAEDTKSLVVIEPSISLIADFASSKNTGCTVSFTDESVCTGGTITEWRWDFGDGVTSTEQNPTHEYPDSSVPVNYDVALTVTCGVVTDTKLERIEVECGGDPEWLNAYPNPATRQATFRYGLPVGSTNIELRIFGLNGGEILRQSLSVNETEWQWDLLDDTGQSVANGLYFCMITAKNDAGRTITSDVFRLLVAR